MANFDRTPTTKTATPTTASLSPIVFNEQDFREADACGTPLAVNCSPTAPVVLSSNVDTIEFYSTSGPHGFLSNFFYAPFVTSSDGKQWSTVEHYFQAAKFVSNPEYQDHIRCAKTPTEAKKLGGTRSIPLRSDWETVKEDVMLYALEQKFTQRANLKQLLLATQKARLVEHTKYDTYWADGGGNGNGLNRLGHCLEIVRSRFLSSINSNSSH